MSFEMKENTGSLFKNDKREKETHPHAKGKALIDGVWYWVSAWTNIGKQSGEKYQSLSFTKMEQQPQRMKPADAATDQEPDLADCPF